MLSPSHAAARRGRSTASHAAARRGSEHALLFATHGSPCGCPRCARRPAPPRLEPPHRHPRRAGAVAVAEALLAASGPSAVSPARAALGARGARRTRRASPRLRAPAGARARWSSSSLRRSGCRSTSAAATASSSAWRENGEIGRLLPLYGVLGAAALALAWRLLRETERERAAAAPRDRAPARRARSRSRRSRCSGRPPTPPAQNLLQYFLLPVRSCSSRSWRGRRSRPGCRARSAITAVALGGALRGGRPRRGGDAPAALLLAVRRRSGTRTRASSGSPRCSATRACTAATSCSAIAVVLARCVVPASSGSRVAALIVAFLFAGLFFSYSQSSLVALFAVAVFVSVVAGDRAVRLVAAVTAVLVLARRRRVRRRQGRGRVDAAGHERPLAADRPDGAGCSPAPARRRRPRLAAAREPGASRRTAGRRRSSSRTRRR